MSLLLSVPSSPRGPPLVCFRSAVLSSTQVKPSVLTVILISWKLEASPRFRGLPAAEQLQDLDLISGASPDESSVIFGSGGINLPRRILRRPGFSLFFSSHEQKRQREAKRENLLLQLRNFIQTAELSRIETTGPVLMFLPLLDSKQPLRGGAGSSRPGQFRS